MILLTLTGGADSPNYIKKFERRIMPNKKKKDLHALSLCHLAALLFAWKGSNTWTNEQIEAAMKSVLDGLRLSAKKAADLHGVP